MKDQKFNEIMKGYVKSTSKGAEVDLVKLKDATPNKKISYKFVWSGVAAILIIALICGVAVPFALQTQEQSTSFYYSDGDYIENINFDNLQTLANSGLNVMLPTIGYISVGGVVKKNTINNEIGGALVELTVFDEYFDTISIIFFKDNYIFDGAELYDVCDQEVAWKGISLYYCKQQPDLRTGCFEYMIKFYKENFNYYMNFVVYDDLNLIEIMDMIYVDDGTGSVSYL